MNYVTYKSAVATTQPAAAQIVLIPNTLKVIRSLRVWIDYAAATKPEVACGFALFSGGRQVFPDGGKGSSPDQDGYCPIPVDKILELNDLDIDLSGPPYDLGVKVYNTNTGTANPCFIFKTSDDPKQHKIDDIRAEDKETGENHKE